MSVSWTYLTRRFFLQNYRDALGVGIISSFFASKWLTYTSKKMDNDWILTRVYTDDESDITFRQPLNKSDQAVKREKILKFAAKIKEARAQKERELQLDAFNYLNGKNHTI